MEGQSKLMSKYFLCHSKKLMLLILLNVATEDESNELIDNYNL